MFKKLSFVLSLILFINNLPACAGNEQIIKERLKQTSGVFAGLAISPIVGMARGFSRGFLLGVDFTSEMLGDRKGPVHRMVGLIPGLTFGSTCGLTAGLLKGFYEGVKYGIEDPFSKENFSLTGKSFADYNLL